MPAQWIVWADAATPPGWDQFAQYSVLGLGVLGFGLLLYRVFMYLLNRSTAELAREVARGDRLEAENRALNQGMQDKAIPALHAAATAITDCTELVRTVQRESQRERDYLLHRTRREGAEP